MGNGVVTAAAAVFALVANIAFPGGALEGRAGGNERGVSMFRPGVGQTGFYFTGPSGNYNFRDLAPGRYMVLIHGLIAPHVAIREGETTRLDWGQQPKYDTSCDTWSPGRVVLGQTFRAEGPWMGTATFWIPGDPIRLTGTVHEGGPGGRQVGVAKTTPKEVTWVTDLSWSRGEAALVPGEIYYLRMECPDGKRWNIGTPGPGNVYPHGMAYYDDVPQPDSDLSISIGFRDDSLLTQARGGKNLGFIGEGPGSGSCREAGQTFIATTDNVIQASMRAGWGGNPRDTRFEYAILEGGPDGKPAGPATQVKMVSDWGADALWAPGEVRLMPGERYYFRARRVDGEPFYSYLSRDIYSSGTAWRDGKALGDFELDFKVVGEAVVGSMTYPYNVTIEPAGPHSAVVEWETGTPADTLVRFGLDKECAQSTDLDPALEQKHRAVLEGLEPGVEYCYRAVSSTRKKEAPSVYSRAYWFRMPGEQKEKPPLTMPATRGRAISLKNPGFEDGFADWERMGKEGGIVRYRSGKDMPCTPHSGKAMWGWSDYAKDRPDWREPFQIDRHELIYQTVKVKPGATYEFTAWIFTADKGSGWERDCRVQLIVDPTGEANFGKFKGLNDRCASQGYATKGRWRPCRLRFRAEAERATLGIHFWEWWSLEENHLYVDDLGLSEIER